MNKYMLTIIAASTLFFRVCPAEQVNGDLRVLLFADAQYADKDSSIGRNYRASLDKLDNITMEQKEARLDFAVNLGDTIDGGFLNFTPVLKKISELNLQVYNALGNHDFVGSTITQKKVLDTLFKDGKSFYFFDKGKWRFIVLDPMRLSDVSKIKSEKCAKEYDTLLKKLQEQKAVNLKPWNGGIDEEQMQWLDNALSEADKLGLNCIVFCHMPIYPLNSESLYNAKQTATVLEKHTSLKAYIAGHYHKGGYDYKDGVHYITICGLVEGDDTSYAIMHISEKFIELKGVGKQRSMSLQIR